MKVGEEKLAVFHPKAFYMILKKFSLIDLYQYLCYINILISILPYTKSVFLLFSKTNMMDANKCPLLFKCLESIHLKKLMLLFSKNRLN